MLLSGIMSFYFVVPIYLTLVFVVSYLLVHMLLGFFDKLNFFWDWWDSKRKAIPALLAVELLYFAGILYYIVYWELSGSV